jgi:hypothetical protein
MIVTDAMLSGVERDETRMRRIDILTAVLASRARYSEVV